MCLFDLLSRLFVKKKNKSMKVEAIQPTHTVINNGDWSHKICWMTPPNDATTSKDVTAKTKEGTRKTR